MLSRLPNLARLSIFAATLGLTGFASAQPALFVSQSSGDFGYGYGYSGWSSFTDALDTAFSGAAGTIQVGNNVANLTDLDASTALFLDQRWISGSLSASELTNLTSYISSGKRAVFIGENSSWTGWNSQILNLVGDTFAGEGSSGNLAVGSHALVDGVGSVNTPSPGRASGLTGTQLFNADFARLYGPSANVLVILDVNAFSNTYWSGANVTFGENVIDWLIADTLPPTSAVPEPSTYGLIGAASLLVLVTARRRFRRSA